MAVDDKVGASVQHDAARKALTVIAGKAKTGATLNYQDLAASLGRKPGDARAMAQVCDLLDSAATLARRPLMALWTVRNVTGDVNSQAWVKDTIPGLRELLIEEAKAHEFSDVDEAAIRAALSKLTGMGNRKAWAYVRSILPQEEMLRRLQGPEPATVMDSINDLGTDEPPVVITATRRYVRDMAVRAAVMTRAGGACEFCGEPGFKRSDDTRYLECHHILALSKDGEDRMTNVIALCPSHHREAHFGKNSAEMEEQMMTLVLRKEASPH